MTLTTRPVTTDDLELICEQRERMFRESNAPGRTEEILKTQTEHFRPWLAQRLHDGSYFGYIVEDAGKSVAGIGLMLIDWPPGPAHPTSDKRGYVLNVFVEPSHRRKGACGKADGPCGQGVRRARRELRRSERDPNGPAALRKARLGGNQRNGEIVAVRSCKRIG